MLTRYRNHIYPPYTRNDAPALIITLLILLIIPITVIFLNEQSSTRSQASEKFTCDKFPPLASNSKFDGLRRNQTIESLRTSSIEVDKQAKEYKKNNDNTQTQKLQLLLAQRKPALIETMQYSPEHALEVVYQDKLNGLLDQTSSCTANETTLEGTLEVVHADDPIENNAPSIMFYTLTTEQGNKVSIHPARELNQPLTTGMKIKAKGFKLDNDMVLDGTQPDSIQIISEPTSFNSTKPSFSLIPKANAQTAGSMGDQSTAVIIANSQDAPVSSLLTKEFVADSIYNKLKTQIAENSYNKTALTGSILDIYGPVTMTINKTCDYSSIMNAAIKAADSQADFAKYSRVIIITPLGSAGCSFSGYAWFGKLGVSTNDGNVSLNVAIVKDYTNVNLQAVAAHEYTHTFSISHAGFSNCGSSVFCTTNYSEYNDRYSPQGGYSTGMRGHLNAKHKETIGWLNKTTNIQTVTSNGTFVIEPMETAGEGLKAIRIPRGNSGDYIYVEYRQPIGIDSIINGGGSDVFEGALLHNKSANSMQTNLIDPNPPANTLYSALKPGETVYDPDYKLSITTISRTSSALTVQVAFNTTGPTTSTPTPIPSPTTSIPTATLAPGSNILLNSSFESASGTSPSNWSGGTQDTTVSKSGTASLKLQGPIAFSYIWQAPVLKPSTTYTLQGYIKTQNVLTSVYGVGMRAPITQGTFALNETQRVFGTSDWTLVSRQFTTPPDYAASRIDLFAELNDGATAWFDDVVLCEGSCPIDNTPTNTPAPTAVATPTSIPPTPTTTPIQDNTLPTISITSPIDGSTVKRRGTVTIAANASDNIGVDRVVFTVGGNVSTDYTAPYSYAWSVSGKPNATYTITATAYDASGNNTLNAVRVTTSK